MSLVYRSIWQDDRSDLCGTAIDTFGNWVRKKYGDDFEIHDHADQAPTGQLIVASARSVESEDGQLRCALESHLIPWQTFLILAPISSPSTTGSSVLAVRSWRHTCTN